MREFRARWMRGAALAAGLAAAMGGPARAQPVPSSRVALVVGEGAYRSGPLPTAANDAGLVAQVLAGAGFDVTGARDLDGDGLRRAFRDFLDRAAAAGPDGIAVVYLAGRAVQSDGDDFIVPVDARLARPADVPIEALRLADFTRALAALPIQARVVVVDGAYAGWPAAGGQASDAPGLALVEAEQGELLAFNAAPGTVAPVAAGAPYGAYAQALVAAVKQGGVPVAEVFDRVRLAVNQATGGAVVPWDSDKLTRSFSFFDRAPDAPAVASAQVPFAALEKRPLAGFPPAEAYDLAVARDTLPAYSEFLAAFPNDPLARRVRLLLAVRREALFWRAALGGNTANSFWTYLARYPKGPHAADARRRLGRLAAAAAPPPRFVPVVFDVPPPGPDDANYDRVVEFDVPGLPPPPPPPVFLVPPPVVVVVGPPPPPPGPLLLPVPVPVAIPYVRPPVEPGTLAPPRGVAGGYARPRPYARGPNGDGLVVQAAPPQTAPAPALQAPVPPASPPQIQAAPSQAAPVGSGRPHPPGSSSTPSPAPAAPPMPQQRLAQPQVPPPSAATSPRVPAPPVPPSHALPVPVQPTAPAVAPPAAPSAPSATPPVPPHGQPHAQPGANSAAAAPRSPASAMPAAPPPTFPPAAPQPHGSGAAPGGHPPSAQPRPRPAPAPVAVPADAPPTPAIPGSPHPASAPAAAGSRPPAAPPPAAVPKVQTPAAPADQPHPPAAQARPQTLPPEPAPQRSAPRPAPEPSHAAAPANPPPPARHAPDSPAPDHAGGEHRFGEHPPGEHRQACGHPGEPPCHP